MIGGLTSCSRLSFDNFLEAHRVLLRAKFETKRMQLDNMNSTAMRLISNIAPGQPLPGGSKYSFLVGDLLPRGHKHFRVAISK